MLSASVNVGTQEATIAYLPQQTTLAQLQGVIQDWGYQAYAKVTRNYSAVTAACMLTPRRLFQQSGGFDDNHFAIAYNDVDYCYRHGYLPRPPDRKPAAWWSEPIYCTWHDQGAMGTAADKGDKIGLGTSAFESTTNSDADSRFFAWLGQAQYVRRLLDGG